MPAYKANQSGPTAGRMAGCLILVLACIAIGSVLFALYGQSPGIAVVGQAPSASVAGASTNNNARTYQPVNAPPGADSAAMQAFTDALPAQFKGTQIDGAISVAPDGSLIPTLALRRLFDYFISGYGDYAASSQPTAVRDSIARYTELQGLGDKVRAQVLSLFDDYIRLQQRIAAESASFADTDMADRLRILQDMRIAELGRQAAEAFYGQEEQAIQRALVQQNSQTPKNESSLAYKQARLPAELHNQVAAARQKGATEAQIHAMRLAAVGPQATSRLEALDTRRNQWQVKYRRYAKERDTISQSAMSAEDKTQAITDLRARDFTPDEQRRISALDRIPLDGDITD